MHIHRGSNRWLQSNEPWAAAVGGARPVGAIFDRFRPLFDSTLTTFWIWSIFDWISTRFWLLFDWIWPFSARTGDSRGGDVQQPHAAAAARAGAISVVIFCDFCDFCWSSDSLYWSFDYHLSGCLPDLFWSILARRRCGLCTRSPEAWVQIMNFIYITRICLLKNDEICIKNEDFCIKNDEIWQPGTAVSGWPFVFKLMNFGLKLMNLGLKLMNFVF